MTGLATAALFALGWPLWSEVLLGILLALNLWHCLHRYAWLLAPESCTALVVSDEGARLLQRDGRELQCVLFSSSLVTPYLVVLNAAVEGVRGARSIVVMPDSLDQSAFRQLRVWMKWGVSVAGVAGGREHGGHR